MPGKPKGNRAMTGAEREAKRRQGKLEVIQRWRDALERIKTVETAQEARSIAVAALKPQSLGL